MTMKTWKGWASGAATLAGAACLIATPASAQQALYGYDYNSYAAAPQYSASPVAIAVPATGKRVNVVRGDDLAGNAGQETRPQAWSPASRGFSIRINPTADLAPVEPVTTVTVGGYAKGDLIYDTRSDVGDSFNLTTALDDALPDREHFRAHATQSRLRVRSRTNLPNGVEIDTLIEADFEGAGGNQIVSNSTVFRLRHAWGSIAKGPWTLLIGQNWTNFMSLHAYPDTVDFFGPTGALFKRQGQIELRYSGENFTIEIAAENPEINGVDFDPDGDGIPVGSPDPDAGVISPIGSTEPGSSIAESLGGNAVDQIPDFIGAVQFQHTLGAISSDIRIAGLIGQARNQDDVSGGSDSELRWGVHGGGAFSAGPARLFANIAYTENAGDFQLFGFAGTDVGTTDAIFERQVLTVWGSVAYDLTETLTVNLVGGYADEDNILLADRDGFTVHGNVWYTPIDAYRLGFEVIYGEVDNDPFVPSPVAAANGAVAADSFEQSNLRFQFAGQFFF